MDKVSTVKEIGEAVRRERKALGMTQTELAQASNVGLTFISNLENGKETSEAGKVIHVANMVGLDLFVEKRGQ